MQKKSLIGIFVLLFSGIAFSIIPQKSVAQTNGSDLKPLIESKNYAFVVTHESGGDFAIGTYYLQVINDSLSAALPYHGTSGTAAYSLDDNGINVQTTKYSYEMTPSKNGSYIIKIKLKNDRLTSAFTLRVNKQGYATLAVDSYNRDSVTFQGVINGLK